MNMKTVKILLEQLGLLLVAISIGTGFDWIAHQASEEFAVPTEYFRNKIIFGTVIAFLAFRLLRPYLKTPLKRSAATMAVVAVLLQAKYFLLGYELYFVILFMFIHFIVFSVPGYFIFKRFAKVFSS